MVTAGLVMLGACATVSWESPTFEQVRSGGRQDRKVTVTGYLVAAGGAYDFYQSEPLARSTGGEGCIALLLTRQDGERFNQQLVSGPLTVTGTAHSRREFDGAIHGEGDVDGRPWMGDNCPGPAIIFVDRID